MKPGIFYLYEYNNSQKLRNAGFLKITRYYHSCTLMLNARGIPAAYSDTIKLCAFYQENGQANSAVLAEITCANRAFSARLNSAESRFPKGRTLDMIDGFFLPLPNGHVLAAAAPGITVDTEKLLAASSERAASEIDISDESPSSENSSDALSDEAPPSRRDTNPKTPFGYTLSDEVRPSRGGMNQGMPFGYTFAELEAESLQKCGTEEPEAPDPTGSGPKNSENTAPPEQNSSAEQNIPNEQDIPAEQKCSSEPDYKSEPECPSELCAPAEQTPHDGQNPATEQPSHVEQNPSAEQPSCGGQNPDAEPSSCSGQNPDTEQFSCNKQNPDTEQYSCSGQNPDTEQFPCNKQNPGANQDSSAKQISPTQTVKKIQRSDMTILPRRYWHLANNSFLLHGYHNYHHLILIEKDGHYWLGVPGIYDPREARAARLFGFPQFTDSYNDSLQLTDEECNPHENFGYWCCYLKSNPPQ